MADRTRWQIPVSTVPAIVFALLGGDGSNPAVVGAQVIAPMPAAASTPIGSIYYVSPMGSDSAPGTSVAPWRTIQKAADTLRPGQTAIVAAGKYGERVSVSHSGTSAAPITLQAANQAYVQLLGFDLTGSHWVLSGFDITTRTNGSQGYGIHVSGSAAYDTIQNNYIHELCREGNFHGVGRLAHLGAE